MKTLLRPKVLIPLVLSFGLVAALLTFGDIGKVMRVMAAFPRVYLVYYLLLTVAYEGARAAQWHYLLKGLKVHVPFRAQLYAFLLGEAMKSMPIGNYFQSYLLSRSRDEDLGRLTAASAFTIIIEVAVSLVGVVILGLGDASGPVRSITVIGVLLVAAVAWVIWRIHETAHMPQRWKQHTSWRKFLDGLQQFREGSKDLLRPRVLAVVVPLGAVYLVLGGLALHTIVLGLAQTQANTGLEHVTVFDSLAIYFFSLAIALVFPLPIDFGVTEASGAGAFLAYGVQKFAAVAVMLINRVLSIASALVIAAIASIFMWDELRRAMSERPKRQQKPGQRRGPQPEEDVAAADARVPA